MQEGDDFEELKRAAIEDESHSHRTFKYPITSTDDKVA
jgi:hypothetical protein